MSFDEAAGKYFVVRDVHSSYTSFIPDETANTLRSALLINTSLLRNAYSMVHVDSAPGFIALKDDQTLKLKGIELEYGRVKNLNKNLVADKAIQELELEMLKIDHSGSAIIPTQLQEAVNVLNTWIRNRSLLAQEIIFQRDRNTVEQLKFKDSILRDQQQHIHSKNHSHSSKSKAHNATTVDSSKLMTGDLVLIKSEGNKFKSRNSYIVLEIRDYMATMQKITNGKFMSQCYQVPCHMLYTTVPKYNTLKNYKDWDFRFDKYLSDNDEDDDETYTIQSTPNIGEDTANRSEASREEILADEVEEVTNEIPIATSDEGNGQPHPTRVSNHHRREPLWLRSEDWIRD